MTEETAVRFVSLGRLKARRRMLFETKEKRMRYFIRKGKQGFTLIELMIVVAIVGILAVLAVYGVRKYLANAKTAEARNSLGQVSKDAITAYEKEAMSGTVLGQGSSTGILRALCDSASAKVPSSADGIKGKKYQASSKPREDWSIDSATNKGFSCLKFSMDQPQYYMYNYVAAGVASGSDSFEATANGDLNGDGTLSTFSIVGKVQNGSLNVAPSLTESAPEE